MGKYINCNTYKTGLYKPHTIQLDNNLVSIVYYPVEYTENPILYAAAIDKSGNEYKIYSYDHKTWTGFLAFPNNLETVKGLQWL